MKPTFVPILAGSLLLAAMPALAASPVAPLPYAVVASTDESPATHYLNNAEVQYGDWFQKIANVQKSVTVSADAKAELDRAWDDLKRSWARLQTANNTEWESARAAWERAAQNMQSTWQKVAPQQG